MPSMTPFARLAAGAIVVLAVSHGGTARAENSYTKLVPQVTTTRLDNGLAVVLSPNPRAARVAVAVVHPLGTVDEPRRGVWNLFGALAWDHVGTRRMPVTDVRRARAEDGVGAWSGSGSDHQSTFVTAPSTHLARAIWQASEPMASLFDAVDETTYAWARTAMIKSLRQRSENETAYRAISAAIYPPGSAYHRTAVIEEELGSLSLEDARRIHRACIVPNGATVIVTGNFEPARAEELVKKYFGPIPSSGVAQPCRAARPASRPQVRAAELVFESSGRAMVEIAWPTAASGERDDAALDVAAIAMRERLDDRLVDSLRLARSVFVRQASAASGSMFFVQAFPNEGRSASEVRRALEEELARIITYGFGSDEVTAARSRMLAETLDLEDPFTRASRLAFPAASRDGLMRFSHEPERYSSLDGDAVVAAIRRNLVAQTRVVAVVEKKAGAPFDGRAIAGGKR